jgi:hypothetical protein
MASCSALGASRSLGALVKKCSSVRVAASPEAPKLFMSAAAASAPRFDSGDCVVPRVMMTTNSPGPVLLDRISR